MWPPDCKKIFNVALHRKCLPTPALSSSGNEFHIEPPLNMKLFIFFILFVHGLGKQNVPELF